MSVLAAELQLECDPEYCAIPIAKGEPAAFTGLLVTEPLLLELTLAQETYADLLAEEKRYSEEKLKKTVDGLTLLHETELAGRDREIVLLRAAASKNEWWESPWFWFPVGLLAGGTMVLLLNTSDSQ